MRKIREFDVIAIQEPWRNSYLNTTHHPYGLNFDLLYPDSPDTRTCFLVNKRIPATRWTATHHSPDLVCFLAQVKLPLCWDPCDENAIPSFSQRADRLVGPVQYWLGRIDVWAGSQPAAPPECS
jgi:hypothetical protein